MIQGPPAVRTANNGSVHFYYSYPHPPSPFLLLLVTPACLKSDHKHSRAKIIWGQYSLTDRCQYCNSKIGEKPRGPGAT